MASYSVIPTFWQAYERKMKFLGEDTAVLLSRSFVCDQSSDKSIQGQGCFSIKWFDQVNSTAHGNSTPRGSIRLNWTEQFYVCIKFICIL